MNTQGYFGFYKTVSGVTKKKNPVFIKKISNERTVFSYKNTNSTGILVNHEWYLKYRGFLVTKSLIYIQVVGH